jgi:hypothetical protein
MIDDEYFGHKPEKSAAQSDNLIEFSSKIKIEIVECELCFALIRPWMMRYHTAWHNPPTAPIEASQPCHKCGRVGPTVVDRWPHSDTMRNHPERFMHASGNCPMQPDA